METQTKKKAGEGSVQGKMMSGAEALILALLEEGVDTAFGYIGGAIMPVYDALYHYEDKLKHVMVRHEHNAAEGRVCKLIESCLVEFMCQCKARILAGQFEAEDILKVLAALEILLNVPLDPGAIPSLLAAA